LFLGFYLQNDGGNSCEKIKSHLFFQLSRCCQSPFCSWLASFALASPIYGFEFKLSLSVKPWHLHVFQSGPTWLFHVLSRYTGLGTEVTGVSSR